MPQLYQTLSGWYKEGTKVRFYMQVSLIRQEEIKLPVSNNEMNTVEETRLLHNRNARYYRRRGAHIAIISS